MREAKDARFRRVAEARVNKAIQMLRLLGNCSKTAIYRYERDEVEQFFSALQTEVDNARRRFFFESQRFRHSLPFNLEREMLCNPHIILELPDGQKLKAVAFQQDDYPSINLYLCNDSEEPELICFAEFSPERDPGYEVCVGAYRSDKEDTTYYAPYMAERNYDEK